MAVVRYEIKTVYDDGTVFDDVYAAPEFVLTGLWDDSQRVIRIARRGELIEALDEAIARMQARNRLQSQQLEEQ